MKDKSTLVRAFISNYCQDKGYQVKETEESNKIRFQISNGLERIPLDVYHTGSIVPGGSPKYKLRKEFDLIKEEIESNPDIVLLKNKQKKAISVSYDVLESSRRDQVLDIIKAESNVTIQTEPHPTQLYRAIIEGVSSRVILTQFKNGTLLIQGKENAGFDHICSLIEKILLPTEKDVALRFLSGDEKKMEEFITAYSPEILEKAEKKIKKYLGESLEFLEEYDKKYLIASECLILANITLPEYSPLVMPAAKAFEGFAKKLVIKIGLFPVDHFKTKGANFAILKDKAHPSRKVLIAKEKYADTFLDKLALTLDMARNFMMHSDDSSVTKVDAYTEAVKKQIEICENVKQQYDYFNQAQFGGLK